MVLNCKKLLLICEKKYSGKNKAYSVNSNLPFQIRRMFQKHQLEKTEIEILSSSTGLPILCRIFSIISHIFEIFSVWNWFHFLCERDRNGEKHSENLQVWYFHKCLKKRKHIKVKETTLNERLACTIFFYTKTFHVFHRLLAEKNIYKYENNEYFLMCKKKVIILNLEI